MKRLIYLVQRTADAAVCILSHIDGAWLDFVEAGRIRRDEDNARERNRGIVWCESCGEPEGSCSECGLVSYSDGDNGDTEGANDDQERDDGVWDALGYGVASKELP